MTIDYVMTVSDFHIFLTSYTIWIILLKKIVVIWSIVRNTNMNVTLHWPDVVKMFESNLRETLFLIDHWSRIMFNLNRSFSLKSKWKILNFKYNYGVINLIYFWTISLFFVWNVSFYWLYHYQQSDIRAPVTRSSLINIK